MKKLCLPAAALQLSASPGGIDTEGFNACNGKPSPGAAGCFTAEPDKDGYRNVSGSLRAEGKNKFDGNSGNFKDGVFKSRFSTKRNTDLTLCYQPQ